MTGLYFIDLIVIRLEYLQVILIIAIEDSSYSKLGVLYDIFRIH
jgi:hypothetical protein